MKWLSILAGLVFVGPVVADGPVVPLPAEATPKTDTPGWELPAVPVATTTKYGIAGDPVNLVLVGTRSEVVAAFRAAGWSAAAPITVRSGLGIAVSVAANVPYRRAPVSDLYLFGRKQDLAFEQLAGHSARSRHHVRFWCVGPVGPGGVPVWVGSGSFDAKVGRSQTTGKITHRIAPDIDRERDTILADLRAAGRVGQSYLAPHTGPRVGRNGEGDCYFTDGNLAVAILRGCSTG